MKTTTELREAKQQALSKLAIAGDNVRAAKAALEAAIANYEKAAAAAEALK